MTLSRWAIHHVDVAHWSNGGSLSSSYLLTQLMEVCICISLKWVKRGPELDSIRAGRSLSHCTNETIHHCFVCLYAPSHEQLMCCRRFAAFLLFLYLTFLLSLSHFWGGGVLSLQCKPLPLIVTMSHLLILASLAEAGFVFPWQPRGFCT